VPLPLALEMVLQVAARNIGQLTDIERPPSPLGRVQAAALVLRGPPYTDISGKYPEVPPVIAEDLGFVESLLTPVHTSLRETKNIRENLPLSSRMYDTQGKNDPWDMRGP
jgi:hypothetical protein